MTIYIKLCVDMLSAIDLGHVVISDGAFVLPESEREINYCPWCGNELENWERLATYSDRSSNNFDKSLIEDRACPGCGVRSLYTWKIPLAGEGLAAVVTECSNCYYAEAHLGVKEDSRA